MIDPIQAAAAGNRAKELTDATEINVALIALVRLIDSLGEPDSINAGRKLSHVDFDHAGSALAFGTTPPFLLSRSR